MNKPRITVMGEEVDYDSLPEAPAADLDDYFKPVRLSLEAVNEASKRVPIELWKSIGICSWLQKRADAVFRRMPAGTTEGRLGLLKYYYTFDAAGPVLARISL